MTQNKFLAFFKLVRWGNLLFIVLTQYLIRYFVIMPVLDMVGMEPVLSDLQYFLLVLSTVLMAAAGYVINDYFDVQIDEVNKPPKVIITNVFSYTQAMRMQLVMNVIGILIGTYLGWSVGNFKLGMLFVVIAAFLWFYSMSLKNMFFVGNLIVSVCVAMVVVMPGLFEVMSFIGGDYHYQVVGGNIMYNISGYALFAFVANLIREMVKDIEDMEGDLSGYATTMPLVIGVTATKAVISILIIAFLGLLVFVQQLYANEAFTYSVVYIAVLLQLPTLAAAVLLWMAKSPDQYNRVSNLLKLVMFFGILSMAAFNLLAGL